MIYEPVEREAPIQQGDIFRDVPSIDISLDDITILEPSQGAAPHARALSWLDALDTEDAFQAPGDAAQQPPFVHAVLPVSRVCAIVITQNCDALRAEDISLCEISPLRLVNRDFANVTSTKRLASMLTKQDANNVRWFYLPPDPSIPFPERMAADFRSVLRLPRAHLETVRELRVGRLKGIANEHFREKLASFFRRYAYNAWYPLTKDEFEAYERDNPGTEPYPWQR